MNGSGTYAYWLLWSGESTLTPSQHVGKVIGRADAALAEAGGGSAAVSMGPMHGAPPKGHLVHRREAAVAELLLLLLALARAEHGVAYEHAEALVRVRVGRVSRLVMPIRNSCNVRSGRSYE